MKLTLEINFAGRSFPVHLPPPTFSEEEEPPTLEKWETYVRPGTPPYQPTRPSIDEDESVHVSETRKKYILPLEISFAGRSFPVHLPPPTFSDEEEPPTLEKWETYVRPGTPHQPTRPSIDFARLRGKEDGSTHRSEDNGKKKRDAQGGAARPQKRKRKERADKQEFEGWLVLDEEDGDEEWRPE